MNFNIPDVGFKFTLTEEWTFQLMKEQRNLSLWDLMIDSETNERLEKEHAVAEEIESNREEEFLANAWAEYDKLTPEEQRRKKSIWDDYEFKVNEIRSPVTLPVGTELTIDRIYIRKGMNDFSSLTFNINHLPNLKKKGRLRFFASLEDVNNINY